MDKTVSVHASLHNVKDGFLVFFEIPYNMYERLERLAKLKKKSIDGLLRESFVKGIASIETIKSFLADNKV